MREITTNMICICCPLGCNLIIAKPGDKYLVTGNRCPRGSEYAHEELIAPKRIITSTVKIAHGTYPVIPVKTDQPIPKEKTFTVIEILANVTVQAPVQIGDVIVENIANTGANIITTKGVR